MDRTINMVRQSFYTTVFSQCFSPCGEHLATCDNFGNLAIYRYQFKYLTPSYHFQMFKYTKAWS